MNSDDQRTMETNLADIDSLQAGRELDALVHVYVLGGDPKFCFFNDGTARDCWHNPYGEDEDTLYSTNIALAWLVADKIPRFAIQRNPDGSYTAGQKDEQHMLYWEECADAPTVTLAICRAALKVVKTAWENTQNDIRARRGQATYHESRHNEYLAGEFLKRS